MDDFTSNILNESKNEWSVLLINHMTCHIIEGFKSIFDEALQLCQNNDEPSKYLMTYQNLLSRVPNWNQSIVENEKNRIITKSKCSYLEDLVTCVHIIQLKLLSCVRVGNENKKINIDLPDLSLFLHKIYINISRKLYSNIYLFELDIPPLEKQKRNREFELLVQTSIMNTIRDQLPVEQLLRQYIDETQQIDVLKVEKNGIVTKKEPNPFPPHEEEKIVLPPREEEKIVLTPREEEKIVLTPREEEKIVLTPREESPIYPPKEELFDSPKKISFSDETDNLSFKSDIICLGDKPTKDIPLVNDSELGIVSLDDSIIDLDMEGLF
ncbi:hypothetical protein 162322356 [Organic Lake phycodnavirus 1]|nr:hypothetical protein 162322356 [Organic Lake phycodnavirus 1]